jgi:hypothetical protein
MTTLRNTSGSKAVKIVNQSPMYFIAFYVLIYNGEEDVIQTKTFTTLKGASKWANKILN